MRSSVCPRAVSLCARRAVKFAAPLMDSGCVAWLRRAGHSGQAPTVMTTVATLGRTTVPKLLGDRSSDVTPTTLAPLTSVPTICRRPGLRRSLIAPTTPGHGDGEHGGLYGGHREQRHVAVLRR